MKQNRTSAFQGFTLGEMLIATAIGSVILAAIFTASVALQKSFNAANDYFYTHLQQIRIMDCLSRDVKRSYIVHTAVNPQTVTCTIPNYVIHGPDPVKHLEEDSDYNGSNADTRRTPIITSTPSGMVVNYGRQVSDGVITTGSATLTSATANFTASDVGASLTGNGIPTQILINGVSTPTQTTIQAYVNSTTVTMSINATASATNDKVTIVPQSTVVYSISGNYILRKENNVITTIASATGQLVPSWGPPVNVVNTEYLTSTVTFQPIFTSGNASAERTGTTVYATAYLRNLRRGN